MPTTNNPKPYQVTFPPAMPQCVLEGCKHEPSSHRWVQHQSLPYIAFMVCNEGCSGHGPAVLGMWPCAHALNVWQVAQN